MEGRVWAALHYVDPVDPVDPGACAKQTRVLFEAVFKKSCLRPLNKPVCMYLRHKNRGSLFMENRRCIFAGKKAPAGAHPVAPNLDNTDSVYVKHRNTDSMYVMHTDIYL